MCGSIVDIHSVAAEIRRGKKKKLQSKNIMSASATQGGHRKLQQEGQHPLTGQRAATGQPVSRTQASDAMTSWLPCYEAKCVQRRCFQCRSVPLRSDIKGME